MGWLAVDERPCIRCRHDASEAAKAQSIRAKIDATQHPSKLVARAITTAQLFGARPSAFTFALVRSFHAVAAFWPAHFVRSRRVWISKSKVACANRPRCIDCHTSTCPGTCATASSVALPSSCDRADGIWDHLSPRFPTSTSSRAP